MRPGIDTRDAAPGQAGIAATIRARLAAALSDAPAAVDWGDLPVEAVLVIAEAEGVLPLLEWRLRERNAWQALPAALREGLAAATRQAVMAALFRERETRRIAQALADIGARALLLKGNALALWLYPQPYLRTTSDIDLLVPSRAEALRARHAFARLGYAMEPVPGGMIHEMKGKLVVDGVARCEIDLHDRLLNAPLYADVFTFDELWTSAVELPALGKSLKTLAPPYAFAHACMNRALDRQLSITDRLKLLYDMHLFCANLDQAGWQRQSALLRAKGIAGSCLPSILDAVDDMGTRVPEQVLAELASQADSESLDWRRFRDWRYMQWRNLRALPGMKPRIAWLWQRLFPPHHHLVDLYGESSRWKQATHRLKRLLSRLTGD